ncbi:ATP-dependent helicase [Endozoicomonas sp. SCSIO W0465]|uniref:ATP-dependent helicase n=1 Tax=Endozoicomonas sp. SCSIO W0465 TaxID=2918516 RepID=UPI0020758162|nr:ATP-dependent helicase [Endozoicomonas sp. SCSIO W0465]USE34247.1 ATP-dependent helicase [Endozoicomonas sp. SCSIO W0465]
MKLTPHQQAVANHDKDHALCIAVAGSGKTSTLAQLVSNLLHKGANPRRLMVMMFNKAAQIDFGKKLRTLASAQLAGFLENQRQLPEIRTYHATGLKLLRTLEGWQIRTPYNKQPLSEKVIELQVRALILKLAPETVKDRMRSDAPRLIEAAISFIESVKAHLTSPGQWFEQSGYTDDYRFFIKLFDQFEQWRHQQRSITFTDMLYDPVTLIRAHPELVPKVADKMDIIIVDEYQDTSTLQHQFTRLIAGQRARMIAVGDPDQTIYEFAGANIDNILNHFQQDYGDTGDVKELTMPHTFRYGHSIALAASHLISQNRSRKDVLCIAHPENAPSLIRLSQPGSDDSRFVVEALTEYLASGTPPEDIAILVRVWAQAVPIELNLLEMGIPYRSDGPSLFQRPEIESLIDAMTLASGGFADLLPEVRYHKLARLLTLPHIGLKQQPVDWLCQQLKDESHQLGKTLGKLAPKINDISDFQARKLTQRAELFTWLEHSASKLKAHTLIAGYIQRSELYDSLRSMSLNEQRTDEQILAVKGFHRFLKQLNEDTAHCCQHIAALIEKQKQQKNQRQRSGHGITLSSCHRAKGLEWPVVLLPGLTRQYWPFLREDEIANLSAHKTSNAIESERRLLYVAMTRAKQQLHLFTAQGDLTGLPQKASRNQSWSANRQPLTGSEHPDRISPFLLEMNLPHVLSLGNLLHDDADEDLAKAIDKTGLTPVSRRYVCSARPALTERLKAIPDIETNRESTRAASNRDSTGASSPGDTPADGPWQLKAVINHAIFGRGEVIEVNDRNFSIRFDSRQHGIKRFARIEEVRHLFSVLSV